MMRILTISGIIFTSALIISLFSVSAFGSSHNSRVCTIANSPSTVVDDASYGFGVWTNPQNAIASDNAYATRFEPPMGGFTHYLKATNFGFSIPVDVVVKGIVAEVEMRSSRNDVAGYIFDERVRIVKNGIVGNIDKARSPMIHWPTTDTYISYGSSTDLWGEAWMPVDINSSNFGVVIAADVLPALGDITAFVDHIRLTVYYQSARGNKKICN